MPLIIGSGPSCDDFNHNEIEQLAMFAFTIVVNSACKYFPSDVIVALDPQFIVDNFDYLSKIKKPIITREFPSVKKLELDMIFIPMDSIVKYPFSGMVAAKIGDEISKLSQGRHSYLLGIDGGKGNHKRYGEPHAVYDADYEGMGLSKTISLAIHSRISCWPKMSKLPHVRKVIVSAEYRAMVTAWLRANAGNALTGKYGRELP